MTRPCISFLSRLFLVGLPVGLWIIWQVSLPANQYTFRGWESLIAGSSWRSGFFPSQQLAMTEVGDLAPYTMNAVPHEVFWQTDAEGYRNSKASCDHPEVVVLGDSMAMGASLSQPDTLPERLGRSLKTCVRSFAGGKLSAQIESIYKQGLQPKWVVLALVERNTHVLEELNRADLNREHSQLSLRWLEPLEIAFTRLRNNYYWNYRAAHGVWGAVERSFTSTQASVKEYAPRIRVVNAPKPELLYFGNLSNANDSDEYLAKLRQDLNRFSQKLNQKNAKLVLTFIPNKESVYQGSRSALGEKLKNDLVSKEFTYVDAISYFRDQYKLNHELLYQTDDTHWNARGVETVAMQLRKVIELGQR